MLPLTLLAGLVAGTASAQQAQVAIPEYTFDVTLVPESGTLDARVTITWPTTARESAHRLLLGRTYVVGEIEALNADVTVTEVEQPVRGLHLITIRPRSDRPVTLRIEYAGPLFAFVNPPMNVVSRDLIELSVDSFWLPFSAMLGASFIASGVVHGIPAGAIVVANHPIVRTADGLRVPRTPPTGDVAFVAARGLTRVTDGRLDFVAIDVENDLARYYRRHGSGAVEFLEGMLGASPTNAATIVVVRRTSISGYARPGYLVVTEKPGATPKPGDAKFVAHELAHSWFSRADFLGEDYWLVEGTAEYVSLRYVEQTLGATALAVLLLPKRADAETAGPVVAGTRAGSAALYAKAPLLLFDLERSIGRPKVDMVLRELASREWHTTAVFLEILRMVAGDGPANDFDAALRAG